MSDPEWTTQADGHAFRFGTEDLDGAVMITPFRGAWTVQRIILVAGFQFIAPGPVPGPWTEELPTEAEARAKAEDIWFESRGSAHQRIGHARRRARETGDAA